MYVVSQPPHQNIRGKFLLGTLDRRNGWCFKRTSSLNTTAFSTQRMSGRLGVTTRLRYGTLFGSSRLVRE